MNGKGVKRPLPGTPIYSSFRLGGAQTVERKPPSRRNRANPPTYGGGTHSFCWWCHRRWKPSTLRLAGIVGIQVLSLTVCCRGFTPPNVGVGITLDRRRAEDSHGGVLLSDSYGCKGKGSMCRRAAQGGMCGAPPRGPEAWRRRRGRRRPRNGEDGLSVDGYSLVSCRVSWLPGAEAERPLGLLYDRTLLTDASSSRRDGFVESGEPPASKTTGTLEAAVGARSEEEVGPVTQAVEGCERSSVTDGIASNLTARWSNVVNGALAETSQVMVSQRRRQQQDEEILGTKRQEAAPAGRRKWSGKGWLGIGASWRAGEGWGGPREDQSLARSASATAEGVVLPANATASSSFSMGSGRLTVWASGGFNEVGGQASWRVWRGPTRRAAMVELAGEKVDEDEEEVTEDTGGGMLSASARAELTLYLLVTGATHYEVADASAALFAVEVESALTGVTWRRWRRNLDGLTSNGFSGSDVANMLTLCPRLLALDFEGQVVPVMVLLREALGMRPTDMRRVIRKAPEVLAPRPDGSTAAETVEVLRALGFQTRHVRGEALRWPQLLAVPPANFFQLAAFLASEEVGIKAADVGSLVRQAPWLALERIDGQMVAVVEFLRRAGVTDLERVVRAYPKVLCLSVKDDLAPRVRFLWESVGVSEDDLPRVLQAFPLLFAIPPSRMQDVVDFLSEELYINVKDMAKIIRAFPSLLGLERERHMEGVVRYLEGLGVQNVGRFVSRLPPVLGYDVKTNLVPKMEYLVEKMGLSVYDVLTFPAFFSYPLDTIIEPRTEFLKIRGRPVTLVGLNIALQQGDSDFSRKVAKVQPKIYREFKEAYLAGRDSVTRGEADAESLLPDNLRKAIGNMGGQSTSNNLDVTARASGLPPNFPKD